MKMLMLVGAVVVLGYFVMFMFSLNPVFGIVALLFLLGKFFV